MASGSDKSDEFRVLDSDDGRAYPQHILKTGYCQRILMGLTVQFEYFDNWITHSRTPQKYRATNHFHIIYIKFKY